MVKKINNFTYKSFKNYSNPDGLEFKQKNIIFGYNGKGKSALSLGIKKEYFKDPTKTEENLRFYSKDFIKETLLLEDEYGNKKLKGVKAVFGKKEVEAENKIIELQSQIVDTNEIKKAISDRELNIKKEIATIYNSKKGIARIQQKDQSKNADEVLHLYEADFEAAKKIEKDEKKLKEIKGDNKLAEKKQQIESLNIGNIGSISEQDILEVQTIFSQTFQDVEIPSSEIISWLNDGVKIHQAGDNCKFCGSKIDFENITEKVNRYNENKKQKAVIKLQNFAKQLEILENQIDDIISKKESVLSILEKDEQLEHSYKEISNENINNTKTAVYDKISDMNKPVNFNFSELTTAFANIKTNYDKIVTIKQIQKDNIEIQIGKLDILVKGSIAYDILNNRNIQNWKKEKNEKQKELATTERANQEKTIEIERLKSAPSDYVDFSNFLNKILVDISINLKLELSGKDYILKHSLDNNSISIEDISEGERNILALLFFYYELFSDKEQQNPKTFDLIIVDDPVSSLDHINKMYILEMMKRLLDYNETSQIFILTHSWDDFCNLQYGKRKNKGKNENTIEIYRFFEIKKNAGESVLKIIVTPELPYKHHFLEIYELSQKNTDDLTECEIYHYPNIMRSVLEEFMRFKAQKNIPTKANEQIVGRVLFNEEWNKISDNDKTKLGQLLNVCNILSHNLSRNPDEILNSAKFLMTRIEKVDKNHFNTNKES